MVILSFLERLIRAASPCLDTEYRFRLEMSQERENALRLSSGGLVAAPPEEVQWRFESRFGILEEVSPCLRV
jgi:hypothetical protein